MTADPMTPAEATERSDPRDTLSPETWLDEHGNALYRYALLRLRDPHKAEDAVQETLLAALAARQRFTGDASVRTWLTGILKHKVTDQFRRDLRDVELDDPDELTEGTEGDDGEDFESSGRWRERLAPWGDPVAAVERRERLEGLQHCIEALPERLANLYWLREVMEEDTTTICKDLAITPNNLWTLLHRARLSLRRCLDRLWVRNTSHTG
ncbi:MAG: sigma-70 family RNA polymerase sigma factor [Chromatiaceae bacterium]|jgi:RNA polymerase sigma-70 factor (ECF subfamily)|nr:sigma-70 family RNA polymerase sigma factor [Chromatiaceae bacterium]